MRLGVSKTAVYNYCPPSCLASLCTVETPYQLVSREIARAAEPLLFVVVVVAVCSINANYLSWSSFYYAL